MESKPASDPNIRLQWILFLVPVALVLSFATFLIVQNKPRDIRLGAYTSQQLAIGAALEALAKGSVQFPKASSITVHFKGPHPLPPDAEEVFSYNRRLGVLLIYVNRPTTDVPHKWTFSKIVCPHVGNAGIGSLQKDAVRLLSAPERCGCKLENILQIG